jgi:hypothetical protein
MNIPQPTQIDPTQDPAAGGAPISQAQRQELLDLLEKIKGQMKTLEATRFASSNKAEISRKSVLKQVFERLQASGIDLSNRESVAAFIAKLQQLNPELASMFEKNMDALLGKPDENNMNNINDNEALSQNLQ